MLSEKNTKDKLWRALMAPLSPASSNVHFFLYSTFFMVFCTEALKMNPAVTGAIMMASRIFNACTDPLVGALLDRTETKFGKFRPFLVVGSVLMNIGLIFVFQVSFFIPEHARVAWIIFAYIFWDFGFSTVCAVNKSALSVMTRNPQHRAASGIAGGINSTVLNALILVGVTPFLKQHGGFSSQAGWSTITILAVILNILLVSLFVFAVSAKDKSEFFSSGKTSKEKIKFKDYLEVIKLNRPLQMLMISSGSNKLADVIDSACLIYFYIYAVQNISLQPIVSGFSMGVALVGAFVAGGIAIHYGLRNTFVLGAWINMAINGLILIIRPFSESSIPFFIFLMSFNMLCRRMTSQTVDPMIAEIIDYHRFKTGKYMPGIIGSLFSFVDKFISSFAGTIVGSVLAYAGYSAGVKPTETLFVTTLLLYLGAPMIGDLISVFAMRFYNIDKSLYKEMYAKEQVTDTTTVQL
jgi:Na+/melibiose symporter-like transporter